MLYRRLSRMRNRRQPAEWGRLDWRLSAGRQPLVVRLAADRACIEHCHASSMCCCAVVCRHGTASRAAECTPEMVEALSSDARLPAALGRSPFDDFLRRLLEMLLSSPFFFPAGACGASCCSILLTGLPAQNMPSMQSIPNDHALHLLPDREAPGVLGRQVLLLLPPGAQQLALQFAQPLEAAAPEHLLQLHISCAQLGALPCH